MESISGEHAELEEDGDTGDLFVTDLNSYVTRIPNICLITFGHTAHVVQPKPHYQGRPNTMGQLL
eukprot:5436802-Pyramimonas_sp.AAC.1